MNKELTKDLKISLLNCVKSGYIEKEILTELKELFGESTLQIQVVNTKEDLEYYEEYERWKNENK